MVTFQNTTLLYAILIVFFCFFVFILMNVKNICSYYSVSELICKQGGSFKEKWNNIESYTYNQNETVSVSGE